MRRYGVVPLVLVCACHSSSATAPDAPPGIDASATATFAPPAPGAGGDWGRVPYPNDLYLDATGHLALTSLPIGRNAASDNVNMLLEGLATMTGAGLRSNVYFPVEVDPGHDVDASTVAGAAVMLDLATMQPIDADVYWRADLGDIVIAPKLGTVLQPAHTYAAYLTSSAQSDDGKPLGPSVAFLEATGTTTPNDAAAAAAQTSLKPLLDALDASTRASLVSATVFQTAGYVMQTKRMRDVVAATPPAIHDVTAITGTGLDTAFGVQTADAVPGTCDSAPRAQPHSHVAVMFQGQIDLISFLSSQQNVDGFPEYDVNLAPVVQGTFPVKFTMTLPAGGTFTNLPVIIYVHGIGRTRQDMLTQADDAAKRGMAMLAIDLPYHGSRENRDPSLIDQVNELTGDPNPDGFGDTNGDFPALDLFHAVASGGIPALHPRAMGENLRQAAIEVAQLAAFVKAGDPTALTAAAGAPVSFRGDVGLLTESLGAMVTGVTLAIEPTVGVAYLSSPAAGFPEPSMLHSPLYSGAFAGLVTTPYDIASRIDITDPSKDYRIDPIIMLFGNVIERGDAIAYAPLVTSGALRGGTGPDIVVSDDWGDTEVSNDTEESYAKALGLPFSNLALPSPPAQSVRFVTLATQPWPVSGNLPGGKSGCFVVFNPAAHAMLRLYAGSRAFDTTFPPYTPIDPPQVISPTQTAHAHELWGTLFATHFGGATTITDPYAASVSEVGGSSCP